MRELEVPVLISRKRDGGTLNAEEIMALVEAYMRDEVTDAQIAALFMAGVVNGFDDDEAIAFTEAYLRSGEVVDLSALSGPTVDKHSTGGVGDSTTLVVAPLLAELGCQVAKLSGRGLSHTGGTLDKLESIPGYSVDLSPEQLRAQVEEVGVAVAAATSDLVPADKRTYALRDVTGTVPSEALVAASVMSKKLAGGAQHITLDVKFGTGAFMRTLEDARSLARRCVAIGAGHGRRISALVTRMDQPLGPAVGNALEVRASVDVLRGEGGARLRRVCIALATEVLALTGVDGEEAERRVTAALDDGRALERFGRWVEAQGGDPRVADDPGALLPVAPVVRTWTAPAGTLHRFDAQRLGELASRLGAGRSHPDDTLDPRVGLVVHAEIGDEVGDGPTVTVHGADGGSVAGVLAELPEVVTIGDPIEAPDVVAGRVGDEDLA